VTILSKSFRAVAALAFLLIVAAAQAEPAKPLVVVSLASYDKLMADLDFFGQLAGKPGASQQLQMMTMMFTQGQGLKGLDKSKPIGVAVMADGSNMSPVVFMAVNDPKGLLDALAQVVGPAQQEGDAFKVTSPQGVSAYIRGKDGWAFVTQNADAALPEDPTKLLAGLDTDYDIAARAYVKNIPPELREAGIQKLRSFLDLMTQIQMHQPGQMQGMAELNKENVENSIQNLERLAKEADQITIGWKLDTSAKNTYLDISFTALPGTQMEKQFASLKDAKSNFSGFMSPDAAVQLNFAGTNGPEQIQQALNMLQQFKAKAEAAVNTDNDLSDEARSQVKTVLGQLFDVAEATTKTGKSDAGAVVMLAPGKLQIAGGAFVADGAALDSVVKNLINLAKGEPDFEQHAAVKLDMETYKDIHFHQVTVKLDDVADEKARKVFGGPLEIYFGTGPKSAYLAVGPQSLDVLKGAIDRSASQPEKPITPMTFSLAVSPLVSFIAAAAGDSGPADPKLNTFMQELDKVKGRDHVLVTTKPISNGGNVRIEVESGVFEAIGNASKSLAPRGPGGPAGMPPPGFQPGG
jgi:hypothetical protein